MRLTSFTDYGLRVLMRLAGDPEASLTTDALASELALSRHHLQKVVQELSRAGWVATRRGTGGGLRLAVEPTRLSVGDRRAPARSTAAAGRVLPRGRRQLRCLLRAARSATGWRGRARLSSPSSIAPALADCLTPILAPAG